MRSKIKGVARLRRLLKRLPDATRQEMIVELNVAGREAVAIAQGRAPRRRGALAAGIGFKVFPKTLRLQVGLLTKAVNRRLFYGRILDLGRKSQTVQARRRSAGSGTVSTYAMNIKGISGKYFVTGRKSDLRVRFGYSLGQVYDRALRKASTGGGED